MLPDESVCLIQHLFYEFTGKHSQVPNSRADEKEFEPTTEPKITAALICKFLDENAIEYAIGGAIALNFWVTPRYTKDIDLYLFIAQKQFDSFIELMKNSLKMTFLIDDPYEYAINGWAIPARLNGIKVDLLLPFASICVDAKKHRVQVFIQETKCWILSPEILCILKLLYYRKKDICDLQQILFSVKDLDINFVKKHINNIMRKNYAERIATFEHILWQTRSLKNQM